MLHYLHFSLDIFRKLARDRSVRPSTQPLRIFSPRWFQQTGRYGRKSSGVGTARNRPH